MYIVAYYGDDRLQFRIFGINDTIELAIKSLERQTKFDRSRVQVTIEASGYFISNNFFILDLSQEPRKSSRSPYEPKLKIAKKLKQLGISHQRNEKIKKIFGT